MNYLRIFKPRFKHWLLILCALALFTLVGQPPVAAATYTVTNTNDSGAGSLRQAILDANASPGLDTITFAIGTAGSQQTIQPTSALPTITNAVVLDGWSQGGAGYSGPPLVELSGALAGSTAYALRITSGGTTVRGLVINGFASGTGVILLTAGGNWIYGNYIGVNIAGNAAVPNTTGISINPDSNSNVIGTNGDGVMDNLEGNLISGNGDYGILFAQSGTVNNGVAGNKIGTDVSGTAAIPNGTNSNSRCGIYLGGTGNRIGTDSNGISDNLERNLVSGNHGCGIAHNIQSNPAAAPNVIAGNYIGTDASGMSALPNTGSGLSSSSGPNYNPIIQGNVISGNGGGGISISGLNQAVITGNLIGVGADGSTPLGNGVVGYNGSVYGIYLSGSDNQIGGAGPGDGNIVANTNVGSGFRADGIAVSSGSLRNAIRGNQVYNNKDLGLDLNDDHVANPNDMGDPDTGANNLQNYPIITAVEVSGAEVMVSGSLNSLASTTFTLDFYSSPACDPSGFGEGAVYLGSGQVTTDGSGNASFNLPVAGLAADGDSITGTATDPDGNTSEFSACTQLVGEEPISGLAVSNDSPHYLGQPTHLATSLASGTGVSYTWDFGDGTSGSGPGPTHTYSAVGDYTASVTASNSLGSAQASTNVSILPAPTCAATPDGGLTVFGSADESAVQQAVDAAPSGGVVKIAGTCAGVGLAGMWVQTTYINKPLTLAGGFTLSNWTTPDPQAHPTLLDAQGLGRVVFVPSALALNLENLTLANGDTGGSSTGSCPVYGCGGGVYTPGDLSLSNVTFQGNTAGRGGGAYVSGTLQAVNTDWLDNTASSQRGGALEVFGAALLDGGLVQGNSALYAGGIFADAGLVITGTHFLSNTSTSPASGSGGAIYAAGPLDITNALFESNLAYTGGGAVLHSPGTTNEFLAITNTQFLNNTALNASAQGGALSAGAAQSTIQSSIFEGNSTPGASGAGGAIVAYQTTILTDTTFAANIAGGQGGAIYHWGLSESGNSSQVFPLTIATSTLSSNQAGAEGGSVYFRLGFAAANTPIQLVNTTFVNNAATLSGGGAFLGQPASVSSSTFQGNTAGRGGGAYASGTLQATDTDWLGNTASSQRGGALEVYGDTLLDGGLVQGNSALYAGGIFADAGLIITGTHFLNNTASNPTVGSGGAIYATGPLDITNAFFESNQAYTGGGAVLHSPGATNEFLEITNTQFLNNTALNASAQGGALSAGAAQSTIQSSHFEGNSTPGSSGAGGAIVAYQTTILTDTTFAANIAGGQGGAIYHWGLSESNTSQVYPLAISASTLEGNQAGAEGGGLYFRLGFAAANTPIQVSDVVFINNTAALNGGGAYLPQPAVVEGSTFQGNTSTTAAGGGLFAAATLDLKRSVILGNHAATNGGGLALQTASGSQNQVINSVFADNTTGTNGASLFASGSGQLDVMHTTFANSGADSTQGVAADGVGVSITNTIFTGHTVGILASGAAQVSAEHSLYYANQANTQGSVTNLNPASGDPLFLDSASGDYHLALGSAAIDAALEIGMPEDLDRDLRPIIGLSDIGADEFGAATQVDPASTTILASTPEPGQQISVRIPPGATGVPVIIRLLPVFPPSRPPAPPQFPARPGFVLRSTPPVSWLAGTAQASAPDGTASFLVPVEITVTYRDTDLLGLDENSLILAVLDEASGQWLEAVATCPTGGSLARLPAENRIVVTTCTEGEFVLLANETPRTLFLPLIKR